MHGVTAADGLRLVVMGTGPFAVPMLHALCASEHTIAAVVTRPDRAPEGRRPPPNPMRAEATEAGLTVLAPQHVNEPVAVEAIASLRPDLLVVCDYGQILSPAVLSAAPLGGVNLHGSLLPRHRGASPVQWTILSGDDVAGVSVIRMTPALDAGAILATRSTRLGPRETAAELEPRLASLGAPAVVEAIGLLRAAAAAGGLDTVAKPQDATRATRAPRLTKADGAVDWSRSALAIDRLRRALDPWPRAVTFFERADGVRQRLVLEDSAVTATVPSPEVAPGTVLATDDGRLVVACGASDSGTRTALEILRLVPEGRRSMSSAEFLRGSPLHVGSRLG